MTKPQHHKDGATALLLFIFGIIFLVIWICHQHLKIEDGFPWWLAPGTICIGFFELWFEYIRYEIRVTLAWYSHTENNKGPS